MNMMLRVRVKNTPASELPPLPPTKPAQNSTTDKKNNGFFIAGMQENPELGVSPVVLLHDVLVVASQHTGRPAHNQGTVTRDHGTEIQLD